MKRSGQGLIGQSEELDELLSKIIKDETTEGKAARIADDLYIGGETLQETVDNYKSVLTKLNKANLKISPNKTKIFLKSLDVLGWVWKQGGFLSPSPHRVNTLKNTKKEDIKTVKDMRSYIGLYKTLLPASPNLTLLLDSFDKMVADRDSKEPFVWDRELEQSLVKTTEAVDNLQNLYLPHSSKTEADVPGTYFHADVIRRQSQYILTARDHVSSFTAAKIIKAENNKELKSGIIDLIQPIRLHSKITVKVDNATGFKPLLDDKDHDLAKLDIQIEATDIFNKNANAVIDKACYELEQELKRIEPDGRPISNTTLIQAVYTLNQRLRRQGTISAFEMHFNRDMFTGSNLNIDYSKLRNDQLKTRAKFNDRANATIKQEENKVQTGDTVILREGTKKHAAKDVFIVTKSDNEKVAMQKIIHPHDKNEATIRSKVYATDKSRLITVKPAQVKQTCPSPPPLKSNHQQSSWNPIREEFYDNKEDQCVATIHLPNQLPLRLLHTTSSQGLNNTNNMLPPKKSIRHMTGPCSTFSWTNGHNNRDSQPTST